MQYRVAFAPEARDDLLALYLRMAERSGPGAALAYIERIEAYCRSFVNSPKRGLTRDDLFKGLRIIGFERHVGIAFHIADRSVIFDRVLYIEWKLGKLVDYL